MKTFDAFCNLFKRLTVLFVAFLFLSGSQLYAQTYGSYTLYVTVTGAGNHDGSSLANAMTLDEAKAVVNPGDYVLRIKRFLPGVKNDVNELQLKITILPPFWKTIWFLTLLILLVI